MTFTKIAEEYATKIQSKGGRAYYVGGYVRDRVLGLDSKDVDIEVFGLTFDELSEAIDVGEKEVVGNCFGVIKVKAEGYDFDISLPRRERKTGTKHVDYIIESDPDMTLEEAALRRDFTMNAMYKDVLTGEIFDPHKGLDSLIERKLVPVSERFKEDALRVLRGMQFAGRFRLDEFDANLIKMSKSLKPEYKEISIERVWEEWKKWALKSKTPSNGLRFLMATEWIDFYPPIKDLRHCPQNPEYHPEGDVFTHTCHVVDAMAEIIDERLDHSEQDKLVLMFSALCHDFGKPTTTKEENGRITSKEHCVEGVEPTIQFLESIGCPKAIIERVVPLVKEHLFYASFNRKASKRAMRRLAVRLGKSSFQHLVMLVRADHAGRPPLEPKIPVRVFDFIELSEEMNLTHKAPDPIIMGRHLLEFMEPGPLMGEVLNVAYEAQLDGEFEDLESGLEVIKKGLDIM